MADTRVIQNAYTIDEGREQRHGYTYEVIETASLHSIDTPVFGTADNGVVYTSGAISVSCPFTTDALSISDCNLTYIQCDTTDGTWEIHNVHDPDNDTYMLYRGQDQYSSIVSYGMEIHFGFRVSAVKRVAGVIGDVWVNNGSYGYCYYRNRQGNIVLTGLGSGLPSTAIMLNTTWGQSDKRFTVTEMQT